ncbi:hypothetical protein KFE25_010017 [Diacronema lutheri]|uniref:EF-hand domain-containing protein n=1 Tax=Diacronema lutheri TaxID=2081491 RepID=A0A8J6C9K0_DIALT|nr:hypothetical protein KFE25_010017 [Diacronema lutheri]
MFGSGLAERLMAGLAEMADRSGLALSRLLYIQDVMREAMYRLGVGRKGVQGKTLTLDALFRTYDDDHTGRVDARELERAMRSDMGISSDDVTLAEIQALYAALDRDGSGAIDAHELIDFVQITPSAVRAIGHKIVAAAYTSSGVDLDVLLAKADRDKSGLIEFDEFCQFMRVTAKQPPAQMTDVDLRVLFDFLDADGSGSMSVDELSNFLHGEAAVCEGGGASARRARASGARRPAVGQRPQPLALTTQRRAAAAAARGTRRVANWSGSRAHARVTERIRAAAQRSNMPAERLEAVADLMRDAIYRVGVGTSGSGRQTTMRALFRLYDDDDTGELDVRELVRAVRHDMRLSPDDVSYGEIEGLVVALDADGLGSVSLDELLAFIQLTPGAIRKITYKLAAASYDLGGTNLAALFASADNDRSNSISASELLHVIRKRARVSAALLPDGDVRALHRLLDEDSSGQVELSELLEFLAAETRAIGEAEQQDADAAAKADAAAAADDASATDRAPRDDGDDDDERISEGEEEAEEAEVERTPEHILSVPNAQSSGPPGVKPGGALGARPLSVGTSSAGAGHVAAARDSPAKGGGKAHRSLATRGGVTLAAQRASAVRPSSSELEQASRARGAVILGLGATAASVAPLLAQGGAAGVRAFTAPAGAMRVGTINLTKRAPARSKRRPRAPVGPPPLPQPVAMYPPGVTKANLLALHRAMAVDAYIREQVGSPLDGAISELILEIGECALGGLRVSDWLAEPQRFLAQSLLRQRPAERLAQLEGAHLVRAHRLAAQAEARELGTAAPNAPAGAPPCLPRAASPRTSPCVLPDGSFDGRALSRAPGVELDEVVMVARASVLRSAILLPSLGPPAVRTVLGDSPTLSRLSYADDLSGAAIVDGLIDVLASSTTIAAIDALGASLTRADVRQLASAICASRSLVTLALPAARFDARARAARAGAHAQPAGARASRTHERERALEAAMIMQELSRGLSSCATLRAISLRSALLGDAGAIAIARALRRAPAIVRLDVSGCAIGDEGMEAIATLVGGFDVAAELDPETQNSAARAAARLALARTGGDGPPPRGASVRPDATPGARLVESRSGLIAHPGLTALDVSCNAHSLAGALALVNAIARDRDRSTAELTVAARAHWLDNFAAADVPAADVGGMPAANADAGAGAGGHGTVASDMPTGRRTAARSPDPLEPGPERTGPRLAELRWRARVLGERAGARAARRGASSSVLPRDRALLAAALGRALAGHSALFLLDLSGLIEVDVADLPDDADGARARAAAPAAAAAPVAGGERDAATLAVKGAPAEVGAAPVAAARASVASIDGEVAPEGDQADADGAPDERAGRRARPPLPEPWRLSDAAGAPNSAAARRACAEHAAGRLGRSLAPCAELRVLSVAGSALPDAALAALLDGVAAAGRVEVVDCARNGGRRLAGVAAARLLRAASGLRALDLSHNEMSALDAVPLLRALRQHSSLRRLDLSNNRLGAYESVRVGDTIAPPPPLPPPPPADAKKDALSAHAAATSAAASARAAHAEVAELVDTPRQGLRELGASLRHNWALEDLRLAANGLGAVAEPARVVGDEPLLAIASGAAGPLPPTLRSAAAEAQAAAVKAEEAAAAAAQQPPLSAAAAAARAPLARARAAAAALRALAPARWAELTAPEDVLPGDALRAMCAALALVGAPEHQHLLDEWRALRADLRRSRAAARLPWGPSLASAISALACAPHGADAARCARAAALLPTDGDAVALRRYGVRALDALAETVRATLVARPLALALAPAELPRQYEPAVDDAPAASTGSTGALTTPARAGAAGKGAANKVGSRPTSALPKASAKPPSAGKGRKASIMPAPPAETDELREGAGRVLPDAIVLSAQFAALRSTPLDARPPAGVDAPVLAAVGAPAAAPVRPGPAAAAPEPSPVPRQADAALKRGLGEQLAPLPRRPEPPAGAKPALEALVLARALRDACMLPLRTLDLAANPHIGGARELAALGAALTVRGSVRTLRVDGWDAPGSSGAHALGGHLASDRPASTLRSLIAAERAADKAAISRALAHDAAARWAAWLNRRHAMATEADLLALMPHVVRERVRALLRAFGARPPARGAGDLAADLAAAAPAHAPAHAGRTMPAAFAAASADEGALDCALVLRALGAADAAGAHANASRLLPRIGLLSWLIDIGAAELDSVCDAELGAHAAAGASRFVPHAEAGARCGQPPRDGEGADAAADALADAVSAACAARAFAAAHERGVDDTDDDAGVPASAVLTLVHLLLAHTHADALAAADAPPAPPAPAAEWARACALALVRTDCYFQPLRGRPLRLAPAHFERIAASTRPSDAMLRVREMLLSPSGAAVAAGLPAVRSYARTARQLDELLHAAVLPSSALVDDGASILGALSAAFDDVIAREHAPDDLRARARADRAYWQAEQIAALDVPTEWAKVLRWMCQALPEDDMPAASTTLLARAEPLHPASEYETAGHFALRYEALIRRPFKAGRIALALMRVDVCATTSDDGTPPAADATDAAMRAPVVEEGQWLVHAVRVDVEPSWEPLDAVHTWFDMPPFSSDLSAAETA